MTMLFLLGLPVVLLLYLLIAYRGVQEVRRRYPHWAPRRFVAVSFFAGPMLILAAGLIAAWILSGQPGGSDEQHRTGGSLAFIAINALALMATIPAAAIGYIIARGILGRED
jgi:heme/copper-type cytochrome/quinol oxidase subunit 2